MGPQKLLMVFCVSRKMLRSKARFLHEEKCKEMELPPTFAATIMWVQNFMTRHGLCIWNKRTESQKDPEKLTDKLIVYVWQAIRLHVKFPYSDSDIAMDKAAVWQDMLYNTVIILFGTISQSTFFTLLRYTSTIDAQESCWLFCFEKFHVTNLLWS